jgi:hypothetical protein
MRKRSLAVLLLAAGAASVAACGAEPNAGGHAAAAAPSRASPTASPVPVPAPLVSAGPSPAARLGNCPAQPVLLPGPDAARDAARAARALIPAVYSDIDTAGFKILTVEAATRSSALDSIPFGMCGTTVGGRTLVVRILFPRERPSADLSHGVLFMARFSGGWRVWFRYQ